MSLPDGLLVAWYGDDFTGSAAVMEVLTFAGYPSVLFLEPPTDARRARFPGVRGVGIAGTARAHGAAWRERHLPPVFAALKALGAPVTHFKTCSTLDSSPTVGSIGHAVELALAVFDSPWVPVLHAAPAMRRYQAFGNLFAAAPGGVFRLDRHPVVSRHPVTPMDEADVARHLARQTTLPIGLLDLEMLDVPQASLARLRAEGKRLIALDAVDARTLGAVGRLIWEERGAGILAVGSQGIEYALVAHWGEAATAARDGAGEKRTLAVSGSVSSVTAGQIEHALAHGFAPIAFDAVAVARGEAEAAVESAVRAALAVEGGDPLVFTARGPDDPAVAAFRAASDRAGLSAEAANQRLGEALGMVLERALRRGPWRRAVVSGGDTSGHVVRQLGLYALTALAPVAPGAALCRAHSDDPAFDGLELALKGGQMGDVGYVAQVRRGGAG